MADTQGRPYPSGPYTPGDEPPLAFERRRPPRRERPRRGGPPPITLILSAMLLLGVGGAVAFMYRAGPRAPGGAPHPVGTPIGEMRIAAPPQAQPADPAAGLTIYKETPSPASPAFTPAPEQPLPRPESTTPPAPAASAAPVLASQATTPPAPEAAPASHPAISPGAPQKHASAAEPTAKPPATAKAKPKAKTIDALLTTSSGAEPAHKPADKHAAKLAEAAPADAKAKAAKPDKTIEKTPAVASDDAAAAKSPHPPAVQIGAFSSRALAEAAAAKGAGGHARRIVPITRADGTILYRASLTGFASRDAASAFCGKLKASGASCFVPR